LDNNSYGEKFDRIGNIIFKDRLVISVSNDFLKASECKKEDIISKNILEVCNLLRLTCDLDKLSNNSEEVEGFLFTKSLYKSHI